MNGELSDVQSLGLHLPPVSLAGQGRNKYLIQANTHTLIFLSFPFAVLLSTRFLPIVNPVAHSMEKKHPSQLTPIKTKGLECTHILFRTYSHGHSRGLLWIGRLSGHFSWLSWMTLRARHCSDCVQMDLKKIWCVISLCNPWNWTPRGRILQNGACFLLGNWAAGVLYSLLRLIGISKLLRIQL